MNRVVIDELDVFLIFKRAPLVSTTAHGVESPHVGRAHMARQNLCTCSPVATTSTEVEGRLVHIAHF